MSQGGSGASALAQAISQAIAQDGCSAIQPTLASKKLSWQTPMLDRVTVCFFVIDTGMRLEVRWLAHFIQMHACIDGSC